MTIVSEQRKVTSRRFLTPHILLFVSTLIYFSPYFVGSFEYILPSGYRSIHTYSASVGLAVAVIIVILLLTAFLLPRRQIKLGGQGQSQAEASILLIALLALMVYVVIDGNIFATNKQEMLEGTDRIHLAFYQTCGLAFIFSFLSGYGRHQTLFIASVFGLLLILYAGHRSNIVISVLGAAYVYYRTSPMTGRFGKFLSFAIFLFLVLSVYKSIYIAVKVGNWELVAERLSPVNLASSALVGMEQFVTFAHLDFMVTSNFQLTCSNAWLIPVSLVPFMDEILAPIYNLSQCDYNTQVQSAFFSGYSGGVAANIWAEFYGYFGYIGFPILILILSGFFWLIEYFIQRIQSPLIVSGLIIALINMSFYIQRKELFGGFISAKRAVLIAIILFLITWVLRKAAPRRGVT